MKKFGSAGDRVSGTDRTARTETKKDRANICPILFLHPVPGTRSYYPEGWLIRNHLNGSWMTSAHRYHLHLQRSGRLSDLRITDGTRAAFRSSRASDLRLEVQVSCSTAFTSCRKDSSALLTRTPPKPRNPPSLDAFAALSATFKIICL